MIIIFPNYLSWPTLSTSLWEETGENPRLSAECWPTLSTCHQTSEHRNSWPQRWEAGALTTKPLKPRRCDFFITFSLADCISHIYIYIYFFFFDQMVLQGLVPRSSTNYETQCSPKLLKVLSELWRRERSCTCTTWTLAFTFRDRLEHYPGPLTGELGIKLHVSAVLEKSQNWGRQKNADLNLTQVGIKFVKSLDIKFVWIRFVVWNTRI